MAGTAIVNGQRTVLVLKLDPAASAYQFETYLSGSVGESVTGIAVDAAGNTYVVGSTTSPDFPVTGTGPLATPASAQNRVGFVTKLTASGAIAYSVTLTNATPAAIAVNAQNEAIVTGRASAGFTPTPGAFQAQVSTGPAFILKLNPAGTQVQFATLGVGGSSIALDSQANIFVSGSAAATDYPTTPGAFQTKFVQALICGGFCQFLLPSGNQYVSKLDSTGSKLVYSTGLNGMDTLPTQNAGLAVDAAGSAYVTGNVQGAGASSGKYPYSDSAPSDAAPVFVSKLKPDGSDLVFSVHAGGAGIQLDAAGNIYVGGTLAPISPAPLHFDPVVPALPPGIASLAAQCRTYNVTTNSHNFAMKLDAATGAVVGTQVIVGANLQSPSLAVIQKDRVWIAGRSGFADVPITPGALTPATISAGWVNGSHLAQVDFAGSPPTPDVACVMDAADLQHTGPIGPYQLISLFGTGLGSSSASTSVTFDGEPGTLLYVSDSQINVAVPFDIVRKTSTVMQVSVNGAQSTPRVLPVVSTKPSLFTNPSLPGLNCMPGRFGDSAQGFGAIALNADGLFNSCANPAKPGSVVSLFLNGVGAGPFFASSPPLPAQVPIDVLVGNRSATVVQVKVLTPFVWEVDVQLPPDQSAVTFLRPMFVTMQESGVGSGPVKVTNVNFPPPGTSTPAVVWVSPQ